MMSVTGVVLTYERQIEDWADRTRFSVSTEHSGRLTVDELLAAARTLDPELRITGIAIQSRPTRHQAPPGKRTVHAGYHSQGSGPVVAAGCRSR